MYNKNNVNNILNKNNVVLIIIYQLNKLWKKITRFVVYICISLLVEEIKS